MTTYYPVVCYSSLAVNKLQLKLGVNPETTPARTIMRYNDKSKRLQQTRMTLMVLSPMDFERLSLEHYFDKNPETKREVEMGKYHIREGRMPSEKQSGNLYLRFDKRKELSHKQIESIVGQWLIELQQAGVIDHFTLQIPVADREGDGRHKGYGFIRFNDEQKMDDRCVTFAMLQNRRLATTNNFLSVVWAEKNKTKDSSEEASN